MKGTIRISRTSSNRGPDTIRIYLEDTISGAQFVTAELTPHDLAMALTGMGDTPCTFEVRGLRVLGKQREVKTEKVPVPDGWLFAKDGPTSTELLAPFEVDGWRARLGDLTNHHRCTTLDGAPAYSVTFTRHVDPETGEPVEP